MFESRRIAAHVRMSEPASYDERRNGGTEECHIHLQEVIAQHLSLFSSVEGKKTQEESQTLTKAMMRSFVDTKPLIWIFKKDLILLRIWTSLE